MNPVKVELIAKENKHRASKIWEDPQGTAVTKIQQEVTANETQKAHRQRQSFCLSISVKKFSYTSDVRVR